MQITPLKIPGTYEITLKPLGDVRGYFMRTYDNHIFAEHGLVTQWMQENQSYSSRQGIVRGLHFQRPPHAETKLVRALSGTVLDVFVDLRQGSPFFGQWDTVELHAEKHNMVYIPKGFAHGFCTLTDEVIVAYKVDAFYAPDHEGGLRWNDPTLKIPWPCETPLVSTKDQAWPELVDFVSPFTL